LFTRIHASLHLRVCREARLERRLPEMCAWLGLPSTLFPTWQSVLDFLRQGGSTAQPSASGATQATAGQQQQRHHQQAEQLAKLYQACYQAAGAAEQELQAKQQRKKPAPSKKCKVAEQAAAPAAGAAAAAAAAAEQPASAVVKQEGQGSPSSKVSRQMTQKDIFAAFGKQAGQQKPTSGSGRQEQQQGQAAAPPGKGPASRPAAGLLQQGGTQAQQAQQQQRGQQQPAQQEEQQQQQVQTHQLAEMSPTMRLDLCIRVYAALLKWRAAAARQELRQLQQQVAGSGRLPEWQVKRLQNRMAEAELVLDAERKLEEEGGRWPRKCLLRRSSG